MSQDLPARKRRSKSAAATSQSRTPTTTVASSGWRLLCLGPCLAALTTCYAGSGLAAAPEAAVLRSPDDRIEVAWRLDDQRRLVVDVAYQGQPLAAIEPGLRLAGSGELATNLEVVEKSRRSRDQRYLIPVGKSSSGRDHCREVALSLEERDAPHRRFEIVLRAYDDGVAFQYVLPEQPSVEEFALLEELTAWRLPGEATAYVLPLAGHQTSYEAYYEKVALKAMPSGQLYGLPMLVHHAGADGKPVWLALTEANLTDYAGMYLTAVAEEAGILRTQLSPLPDRTDEAKVVGETPHASPWRVLMIGDEVGTLLESQIVFHLSDPCAIEDVSWIRPGKTTFPWWNRYVLEDVDFQPGVNTETAKHYIDFCAEHGIEYHSLDGLDIAWYGGPIQPDGPTDVTTAAESIDLPELLRYAQEKGVRLRLWMHWKALRPQIDEAFALYERWGIEGVMVDFMDRDDQEMVRFYHEMAEKAAKHHLTLTLHGSYKPTGMERTWPNVLSYEGVLNQEYNKWATRDNRGASPKHNLDVAFLRMLAGPLDYHQGGVRNVLPENYRHRSAAPPVQGTRGHQAAMYVVYQNHLPMLVDYPAAYRRCPELELLAEIPCTWDEMRVLHAEIDSCLVVARRSGTTWYLAGMTANSPCELELPLESLGDGPWIGEVYLDEPSDGPTAMVRQRQAFSSDEKFKATLPRCGGFVARLSPK